jgi:F-type H+-transporting ATPase subunit epsilon
VTSPLTVTVVASDREVWSGEATMLVARTTEGELGILAGHEPFLGVLSTGEVRIHTADSGVILVKADGGFLSVEHNTVTVVASQAELVA